MVPALKSVRVRMSTRMSLIMPHYRVSLVLLPVGILVVLVVRLWLR
jgi:hypothetical protein